MFLLKKFKNTKNVKSSIGNIKNKTVIIYNYITQSNKILINTIKSYFTYFFKKLLFLIVLL